MALALNTSHPLYSELIALICVDDDNVIKDLKGDTCTPDGSVTQGTGSYGRHFRTTLSSGNALGVTLTSGFLVRPATEKTGTTFVAVNNIASYGNKGSVFNTAVSNAAGPGIGAGGVAGLPLAGVSTQRLGTTALVAIGSASFGCCLSNTETKTFANGSVENTTGSSWGNYSDTYRATYIGGDPTGGYGGCAADYVWVAHFRKYLTNAEILDLHNSLGASNAFGLVGAAAATATTLSGPSSGTVSVASTNFTVGANGTITGTVTVTPADGGAGGTFTPTTVAISSGTPTGTFTYTPASTGVKTISISDDGGLTDASTIAYTSNAAAGAKSPAFYQTFIAGR